MSRPSALRCAIRSVDGCGNARLPPWLTSTAVAAKKRSARWGKCRSASGAPDPVLRPPAVDDDHHRGRARLHRGSPRRRRLERLGQSGLIMLNILRPRLRVGFCAASRCLRPAVCRSGHDETGHRHLASDEHLRSGARVHPACLPPGRPPGRTIGRRVQAPLSTRGIRPCPPPVVFKAPRQHSDD